MPNSPHDYLQALSEESFVSEAQKNASVLNFAYKHSDFIYQTFAHRSLPHLKVDDAFQELLVRMLTFRTSEKLSFPIAASTLELLAASVSDDFSKHADFATHLYTHLNTNISSVSLMSKELRDSYLKQVGNEIEIAGLIEKGVPSDHLLGWLNHKEPELNELATNFGIGLLRAREFLRSEVTLEVSPNHYPYWIEQDSIFHSSWQHDPSRKANVAIELRARNFLSHYDQTLESFLHRGTSTIETFQNLTNARRLISEVGVFGHVLVRPLNPKSIKKVKPRLKRKVQTGNSEWRSILSDIRKARVESEQSLKMLIETNASLDRMHKAFEKSNKVGA